MKIVKEQILRVLAFVMAVCLITTCLTGCGKETATNAYKESPETVIESQVLAYNSDFQLDWDAQARAILLGHKGQFWSDILYNSYLNGSIRPNGSSPLYITVVDAKTLVWTTVSSASQMTSPETGHILTLKIENGIRVVYFFKKYKIAIPVDYVFNGDHLTVSIDSSKILEDGSEFKLVNISLNPNLCAVDNNEENSNLFVPTGSGALMSSKVTAQGTLTYEAPVYGNDPTSRVPISRIDNEEIRMPVFGSYTKNRGTLAIIEQSAGAATIKAEAANVSGYSIIYPNFYVRGYDTFLFDYYGQATFQITQRVNDDISGQVFSVSYYPIVGDNIDYNTLAKKYQSYLIEKGQLKKSDAKTSPYSVTFLGGTNITKSLFGIPYHKVDSLTTFSEAKSMLEKLKSDNGVLPQVRLSGYSDNGLRPGKIAGGKNYLSVYGSKKELSSLIDYCKDTNI